MTTLLAILAFIIIGFALFGVIKPRKLTAMMEHLTDGKWLWVAVVFRLLLAVALWFSAPVSRTPEVFRVIACLALLGAILLVVFPQKKLQAFVNTFARWPAYWLSLFYLLGVVLGGFFIWSSGACLCLACGR
jgi:hypothetical protein